jgi:hypothetical protein
VKKRTVATLGRLDQFDGGLDSVINGLPQGDGPWPSARGASGADREL